MYAVEKRLALKKEAPSTHEDVFKGNSKNTGKDFGSDRLFEEQN